MILTAEQLCARHDHLKGQRGVLDTHVQDVLDHCNPRTQDVTRVNTTPGRKKHADLFDNTGMVSAEVLTSQLHGSLTNPSTEWFEFKTGNPLLDSNDFVAEYLQDFTAKLHRILNSSNFQTEIHEYYLDLVTIGTAAMAMEADEKSVVRFSTKHIAEYVIAENAMGMVDELHREFEWDARQVLQEFTKDAFGKQIDIDKVPQSQLELKFGDKIVACYKNGKSDKFKLIHGIYRNNLIAPEDKMPFTSQYVLKQEKKELRQKGFKKFPYLVSRWTKNSNEIYGRSPGMAALPEMKTLQQMVKAIIMGAQKVVNPPVQMPDEGFVHGFKSAPGSIHYYRAGSNDRIEPIFKNTIDVGIGFELIRDRQQAVREAFFIDKLQLALQNRMTTIEVSQRVDEQYRFLSPMMGRQQTEFLVPMVDRLVDIVIEKDGGSGELLGDPPPELENINLDVKYSSPIARAQIINQGQNMLRALEASKPFIEADPNSLDVLVPDEAIRTNWLIFGAPQRVLRKKQEVEEIRDARQQAQQQALQQVQEQATVDQAAKLGPLTQAPMA